MPQQPPAQSFGQVQPSPMQQSIARIYEACQAPPLAPAEYRAVFDILERAQGRPDKRKKKKASKIINKYKTICQEEN